MFKEVSCDDVLMFVS